MSNIEENDFEKIAIIGMGGRFPDAKDIDSFWKNLEEGKSSLHRFTKEDFKRLGYDTEILNQKDFVPVLGRLNDFEDFDASFFNYSPREATSIDPQHRIFMETSWQALHDAYIDPYTYEGLIGVFAGCGYNYTNACDMLADDRNVLDKIDFMNIVGNDKDFISTRVSYKLNLRGPGYTVQSACSTSLLAVHQGVQNLLTYQCDIALCGGVSLQQPKTLGYFYKDGEIFSPSGEVRTFDENANGTVFGEGCGAVVLKRLSEAIEDGDHIYAVIRASAANNDGSNKAGYAAPSVQGQRDVIKLALDMAEISPEEISYIETHGTGTSLGDLIEISALKEVFGNANRQKTCALGAVKANIGHLDIASGVTGLIKAALVLHKEIIPRQISIDLVNNKLKLDESPFYIPLEKREYPREKGKVRYAGISSFGVGGTNVHLILEEAPPNEKDDKEKRGSFFIPVSSHSESSLTAQKISIQKMAETNGFNPEVLSYSHTLRRPIGKYRSGFLLNAKTGEINGLVNNKTEGIIDNIVFLFPGQGSQWNGMGKDLYSDIPIFQKKIDQIANLVINKAGFDIREIMFDDGKFNCSDLSSTSLTQICLFAFELALVKVLETYNIHPTHLLGHSLGEITSAAVSGVFSTEEAIDFILMRGKVMQNGPNGNMFALIADESTARSFCRENIYLAVNNGPGQQVLSCSAEMKEALVSELNERKIKYFILKNSVPFHTPLLKPFLKDLDILFDVLTLKKGFLPFLSNVSGDWAGDEILEKEYWLDQICSPVQFSKNISKVLEMENSLFIEVGPGQILSGLIHNFSDAADTTCIPLLKGKSKNNEIELFFQGLGNIWANGLPVKWDPMFYGDSLYKIHLPTYCFDRKTFSAKSSTTHSTTVFSTRKGLPSLFDVSVEPEVPMTETLIDEIIINSWKDVLGYTEIMRDQDFFSLGGDSILASQIAMKISKSVRCSVRPIVILSNPTVNSQIPVILDLVQSNLTAIEKHEIIHVADDIDQIIVPKSQRRLWFIHEFDPNSKVFNLAQCITIYKTLNIDNFYKAIRSVQSRHDIFQIFFKLEQGNPYLRKNKNQIEGIDFIDYSETAKPRERFVASIRELCTQHFDLYQFPLYKMLLYKIGATEYKFILLIPHVITDGWSFDIFQREIESAYTQLEEGSAIFFDKNPLGYYDYAYWEQNNNSELPKASIDFWKEYLGKERKYIDLPYSYPRPDKLKYDGNMRFFEVDSRTTNIIKELCSKYSVTIFHVLSSLFGLVLNKYSGQDEIVLGIPDANRDNRELENIMGFFLNMLPLKIVYNEDEQFSDIVKNVRKSFETCLLHSDVGYDDIVELLKIPRKENINPLFQVMFAFQNYIAKESGYGNFRQHLVNRGISEYDLSLYMWEEDGCLCGGFEYSTELFNSEFIRNLTSIFCNMLDTAPKLLEQTLSEISVLDRVQQNKLLNELNQSEMTYNKNKTCLDYFKDSVSHFPDKTAVSFHNETISYEILDELSDKTAFFLINRGVTTNNLIGIFCTRGIEMVIGILGILKAGAAYIPLDPHFPMERISLMMDDADLNYIITTHDVRNDISRENCDIFSFDEIKKQWDQPHVIETLPTVSSETRMYVLYTSGSTGKPNGVQISHRNFSNFLVAMSQAPGINTDDRMLALTTLSFDISGLELMLPLSRGASVEIISYETALDSCRLAEVIESKNINIAQATPATWQMLFEDGWNGKKGLKLLCGGEALSKELADKIRSAGMDLWNMYGPTETTVWSSIYHYSSDAREPLIGLPIGNTQFYILDKNLNIVPQGVPGELYIGGDGVSVGYLKRPELNEKRFITDIFSPDHEARMYKTGDRVVYMGKGKIRFLERIDSQVKLRGYRIELGEIESQANRFPGVIESLCLIKEFTSTDKRLLLFIRTDNDYIEENFNGFLQKNLPNYMVPSHVKILEKFPLTPNGKIARKVLLETSTITKSSEEMELPVTETDRKAARIWAEVLQLDLIGINDNFFNCGGHSLLAVQLLHRMNAEFSENWKLRDLFKYPTIKEFMHKTSSEDKKDIPLIFPINQVSTGIPFFLVAGVYDEMYYTKGDTSSYENDFLRYFNNIIVYLNLEMPIFGLRPKGIYRGEKFHKNVKEMAAENIKEIKKLYPQGPYIIGGECLGGVVAHEMVKQLSENNDIVNGLILMDTYKTTSWFQIKYRAIEYRRALAAFFKDSIKNMIKTISEGEFIRSLSNMRIILLPFSKKDRETRQLLRGSYIYAHKLINYYPNKIETRTLLLINDKWNSLDPNLGWNSKDFSSIDIRVVPGNHNTKLSKYGAISGKLLHEWITQKR